MTNRKLGIRLVTVREIAVAGVLVSALVSAIVGCKSVDRDHAVSSVYLDGALRAGLWLQGQADSSRNWIIHDEVMASAATLTSSASIGTGASGRLIFFLELFAATGDSTFLASAVREGEFAMEETADGYEAKGLYNGLAGVAVALTELSKVSRNAGRYLRAAEQRFAWIVDAAEWSGDAARWNESNDILVGAAGIGHTLLYAAREFDSDRFREAARGAGNELVRSAEPVKAGLRWHRSVARELDLPNFSHGTAGVAHFLAALSEDVQDDTFLVAAEAGAAYLMDIADSGDGLFLVPYGIPNDGYVTRYDIGWAHGPAGTGRLFYRLWRITGDGRYRDIVNASARSILAAGVPGPTTDSLRWSGPFRLDRRFGTAGAVSFLLDWYRVEGEMSHLAAAQRSVDQILGVAVEERGLYWRQPRYSFQGPEGDATYTGYFYGVAGYGLSLLEMHYAGADEGPQIRLPDDPFSDE